MTATDSLLLMQPELLVLTMACVVLVADVFSRDREHALAYWLTQLTLIGALMLNTQTLALKGVGFDGLFVRDTMAIVLKSCVHTVTIFGLIYARDYLSQRALQRGEYYELTLMAVLGMMVLISAGSLLTVYLGLELLSLSLYSMVAMHRDSAAAAEAAMKYFVLGAIASGMLLYGISLFYGVTGSVDIQTVASALREGQGDPVLRNFALVFVIAGIAFKLGAVPFHMWLPDVYQGAPTPVTMFIATAPKLAAFAMAMRLLVDTFSTLSPDWQGMVMALAVASIALGNVVALAQTNFKRLLAYSTISHMGFLLLGIVSAQPAGYAGAMFYAIVYALVSLAAFGLIILLGSRDSESDQIEDLKGMAQRSPWFAFVLLIVVFSLAGVPPFAGFWAKWFVIKEIIATGHTTLAGVAVLFSVIGAFYYLRLVRLVFFDAPPAALPIVAGSDMRFALSVNGLMIFALGLMPGLLMAVCLSALH